MKKLLFSFVFLVGVNSLWGAPPEGSPFIKIDQFGYLCSSVKVAVLANPQEGYNADESFLPGETYEVRRWDNDLVVYRNTIVAWKGGETHAQSGDQGWWFDFSAVTEPGSYYLYDPENGVASHRFEIGQDVYNNVLKQAARMFYYQRLNYEKQPQYADQWSDAAAFEGPNQDRAARDVNDKQNAATARDLHGGWMDAGDVNKYTTFTFEPLTQLLEAYRMKPTVFTDDYNLPESGNGVADLLDEIKYELDWLRRMQDATGTNGLMLKVGVLDFNKVSPISADTRPRYYVGECTSSTITGAAVFALAGLVYQSLPQSDLSTYGSDLVERAERAWQRAQVTTQNYTVFDINCDSQEIKAGDADRSALEQREHSVAAAVYLYEATGKIVYKEYVESNYTEIRPFSESFWGPYRLGSAFALLKYTTLPNVSSEVAQAITNQKASQSAYSINDYRAETDLYRAFMEDPAYSWGSNFIRASTGNINLDFNTFSLNEADAELYREVAEQHLHWLNGTNPMGLVMLSNMYDHGAEYSANEIFHTWFADGTKYDNALTSEIGPAPGYLSGGPNKNYDVEAVSPPYGQPHQKSYRDWNTAWNGSFNEKPYQITEPAIYYQASYVALLSRLIPSEQRCLADGGPSQPGGDTTLVPPRYIYQDALAEGWQNWSWQTDVNFDQSTVVWEGERALQATYQEAGSGGLSLRSNEIIATAEYEAIQMELHGGAGAAQELAVRIQTEDNGGASPARTVTTTPNTWQTVTIPLSELGSLDVIKRITVQNANTQTPTPFYLDNLRLVASSTSPSLPTLGEGSITVRAKSDCGSERMQLWVDGEMTKEWTVSSSFESYVYEGFSGGEVSVHLVNDEQTPCDRNLEVDYVTVCGIRYETETQATETSDCCQESKSKLFTNGNFNYGTLSCSPEPVASFPDPAKWYYLENKACSGNGQANRLDTDNCTGVDLDPGSAQDKQWRFELSEDGSSYYLINRVCNAKLDADNCETVDLSATGSSDDKRWVVSLSEDGVHYLLNNKACLGKYLDADNCKRVDVSGGTQDDKRWKLVEAGSVNARESAIADKEALEEEVITEELLVYPNPAQQTLQLRVPNHLPSGQLTLHDLQGRVVLQQKLSGSETINIAHLLPGLYTVRLQLGDTVETRKLVIEK